MFQKLIIVAAWASIVAIAYATLTDIGFVYSIYYKLSPLLMRPRMRTYDHFEHLIAFAIFGGLFAFACPSRLLKKGGSPRAVDHDSLAPSRFGDGACAATTIERASCSATLAWRRGCGGIIRCERSGGS